MPGIESLSKSSPSSSKLITLVLTPFNFLFKLVIRAVQNSDIVFSHPEALLVYERGHDLLKVLSGQKGALVIGECHKIDEW